MRVAEVTRVVIYWTGVHSALLFFLSVMMLILSCCSDLNMHFVYLFLSFFLSFLDRVLTSYIHGLVLQKNGALVRTDLW